MRGNIFHWALGAFLCEAIPIASALGVSFITREPDALHHIIGHEVVVVVAIGIMGTVLIDVIVDGYRLGPMAQLAVNVIGAVLLVVLVMGMFLNAADRAGEHPGTLRPIPVDRWIWAQIVPAAVAVVLSIWIKDGMLRHRDKKLQLRERG